MALSWTASTDNVGVTGYRIQRDGAQVGSSTSPSFTDTTVAPGTSATYTVTAYDSGGNVSAASDPVSVTTPADVSAPSVPSGLRTTDVGATSVALAWDASSDDVRVAAYTVLRDGAPIGTSTTTSFVDASAQPSTTYDVLGGRHRQLGQYLGCLRAAGSPDARDAHDHHGQPVR